MKLLTHSLLIKRGLRKTKKIKHGALVLAFSISFLSAHTQSWVWASAAGGTSYDLANDIYTDAGGNSYITGWYQNTVNFGPATLTSNGGYDFYVAKYDPSGVCLWAQDAGSGMNDIGYGIVADAAGNVYVTGTYWNTIVFGTTSLTAAGGADIFVVKYNAAGVFQWAATAGAPFYSEQGQAIALDSSGNIIINGYFEGLVSFGATTFPSYGSYDSFTAKLNSSGVWQWAVHGGGSLGDNGYGVTCDAGNNIYITGYFRSTATFGSQTISTAGFEDVYIVKYDSMGVCQWAKNAGGPDDDHGNGIVADASGNVYITGWFKGGTMNFGALAITALSSNEDGFVAKYNTAGVPQWALQVGGASYEVGTGICLDNTSSPVISGSYFATFTIGTTTVVSNAGGDLFVAKFDNANGNNIWATYATGPASDVAYKISSDALGNIYCAGGFNSTCYFGVIPVASQGIADLFLAKIDPLVSSTDIYGSFSDVTVFPNPARDRIAVSGLKNWQGTFVFKLIDSFGKESYSGNLNLQDGDSGFVTETVYIDFLQPGIYFYTILSGNENLKTGKLIIQ